MRYFFIFIFICCTGYHAFAQSNVPPRLATWQKHLLADQHINDSEWTAFTSACLAANEDILLISTYRQALDNGNLELQPQHLDFLNELYNRIDFKTPSETTYYTCFFIGRIIVKYHLEHANPLTYFDHAIDVAARLKDKCLTAKAYYSIASYYLNVLHDIKKASEYHIFIEDYLKKENLNGIQNCGVDLNIGKSVLAFYLEDYNQGISYINNSIGLVKKLHQPKRLFDLYKRRAIFEIEKADYNKALRSLDTADDAIKDLPNYRYLHNYIQAARFNNYIGMTAYDTALAYYTQVEPGKLKEDNDDYYDFMKNAIALDIHAKKYQDAKKKIDIYILSLKPWNIQRWRNIYWLKYVFYKNLHQNAEALQAYEHYTFYNDSVHHQKQAFIVKDQQLKYEAEKKERSLQLQIAANKVQAQTTRLIVITAISICLLLLLLLGYKTIRDLKDKEKLRRSFSQSLIQNIENEQNRIANELHDGLGQELLLLKNALIINNDENNIPRVSAVIESVRGISRELYPALLSTTGLKFALENQINKIDDQENIFIDAEIEYEERLDKFIELQVFRVFQEAMTNVLKYAEAASVYIGWKQHKDKLTLTVRDSGKGFNLDEKISSGSAFGLISMQQRAESINGKLLITATVGKGTEINLIIYRNDNHNS